MRVLELCCAEGGATRGYQAAGMEVFAVDMESKFFKRNPAEAFHAGDGLRVLETLLAGEPVTFTRKETGRQVNAYLRNFDAVHVSPPCQGYTRGNAGKVTSWPKLIPDFRHLLDMTGLPYVIENVKDAESAMVDPTLLCGCMFNLTALDYSCSSPGDHYGVCDTENGVLLNLERGRLFETNWTLSAPLACEGVGQPRNNHPSHKWVGGAYGGARRDKYEAKYIRRGGYVPPEKEVLAELLGFDRDVNMTWNGLFECLPPAYTEHVGRQMMGVIADNAR